jgi:hypothetical protein
MTTSGSRLRLLEREAARGLSLSWPDIYFTPGYGHALEAWQGWHWRLALWESGPILFPFLMRPVDPEVAGADSRYDAVSPYGYSGTVALADVPAQEWRAFRGSWRRLAPEIGVVGEFQRLSPFFDAHERLTDADPLLDIRRHNHVVVVPCGQLDEYWAAVSGKVRNRVRRARKLGYETVVRPVAAGDLDQSAPFRQIYEGTMQRVDAEQEYFFPDPYYRLLHQELGDALHIAHVFAPDGTVASAGLLFQWRQTTHFHIAGSTSDGRRDGCNILRLDEQIRWAAETGSKFVNLGGGRTDDDPLFRFKARFGGRHLPFHLATATLDRDVAEHLARSGYRP